MAKTVFFDRCITDNIALPITTAKFIVSFAKNLKRLFFEPERKRYSRQQTILEHCKTVII